MQIGILGAGQLGSTIGRLWCAGGHEVRFGTRNPESLSELLSTLGAGSSAGTLKEAAEFGQVVLLAVPLKVIAEFGADLLSTLCGKTVLDACNPDMERDGDWAREVLAQGRGSSAWIASKLIGASVVKAFNMQRFDTLRAEAHQGEDRLAVALAGDDFAALALSKQLVRDAGFEPVLVGSLEEGRAFDPGTRYHAKGIHASRLRQDMGESHARARVAELLYA
jgi:predicted dinucleotide-binding enzyme